MSYCKTYGKDKVIFATKEDHAIKSKIELPESEPQPGELITLITYNSFIIISTYSYSLRFTPTIW